MISPLQLRPLSAEPLVSIITSNYNYEAYVASAIESVLSQTYQHFEMVVCDDGSTDGSWEILSRYAAHSSRIKAIRKANGGQASGFNEAYSHTTGDIICFLDADDVYRPRRLERVVEAFREHPDAGVVAHRLARVTASGENRGVLPFFGRMPNGWCAPAMLRNGGILANLPAGCVCCLRREVADRIFPLPVTEATRHFGDTPILRMAPLLSPVVSLPDILYDYRLHGRNNGNVFEITPVHIERELEVYRAMWALQRDYLAQMEPGLEASLAPLEANQHVITLQYLKARLQGDRGRARSLRAHMRPAEWVEEPAFRRWFWSIAPYLPDVLFRPSVHSILSQGRVKQLLAPLVHAFRRKSFHYA